MKNTNAPEVSCRLELASSIELLDARTRQAGSATGRFFITPACGVTAENKCTTISQSVCVTTALRIAFAVNCSGNTLCPEFGWGPSQDSTCTPVTITKIKFIESRVKMAASSQRPPRELLVTAVRGELLSLLVLTSFPSWASS